MDNNERAALMADIKIHTLKDTTESIYTGVFCIHGLEYIYDDIDQAVDLDFAEYCKNCDQRGADDCECTYESMGGTYLIGFAMDHKTGLYEIDDTAEYSAIVNTDRSTVQVVKSAWLIKGAPCSPCYPGQIDGGTPGDYWCYSLPPDVIGTDEHCLDLSSRCVMVAHKDLINSGAVIVNPDDYVKNFWGSYYKVFVSARTQALIVNAGQHYEAQALDLAADYCTVQQWDGLFLDDKEIEEYTADGTIDDYPTVGNESKYFSSHNVHVFAL